MTNNNKHSLDSDNDAWYEYIKLVSKLNKSTNVVINKNNNLYYHHSRKHNININESSRNKIKTVNVEQYETKSNTCKVQLQLITINRKERRRFIPQVTIDLHGYTTTNLDSILFKFCMKCIDNNIKHIKVITGKGTGKVREFTYKWLSEHTGIVKGFFGIKDSSSGSGSFGVEIRNLYRQ